MAPDVGFEPTTKRLTAAYSTAELIWNNLNNLNNKNLILAFFLGLVNRSAQKYF